MMINKRLISMMGDSKRYIAWNVVLQFLALLANIVMIFAVSLFLTGLVRREPDLPTALLYILGALIVRFFCTRGAASASYNASCTVKKTLRAAIYEKLLRLGGSYTQAVPTAEVLQLAGEGVEQLETYFGAYLPQFFYAMIAPGHAVYCAGPSQSARGGHPDDLCAADSRFHRGCAEVC